MWHCFSTWLQISHNFQDIHHYILNMWEFCVCSIIQVSRRIATGRRITIWAIKQKLAERYDSRSSFFSFVSYRKYASLYKSCLLKSKETWSQTSSRWIFLPVLSPIKSGNSQQNDCCQLLMHWQDTNYVKFLLRWPLYCSPFIDVTWNRYLSRRNCSAPYFFHPVWTRR